MDYQRVYEKFIRDRRQRELSVTQGDRHHVVPLHLGGGNEPENLIKLTHADHLFAHVLLAKIHGGWMVTAAVRMAGMSRYRGKHNRERYQHLREQHRQNLLGNKHTLGYVPTAETRAKLSAAGRGRKQTPESIEKTRQAKIGKPRPDSVKQALREFRTGRKHSEQTLRLIAQRSREAIQKRTAAGVPHGPTRGMTMSEEARQRMSVAQRERYASRPMSDETRQKLSESAIARHASRKDKP